MHIAMRIDADHVVQLICKLTSTSSPALGDSSGAGLEVKTAGDRTVTSHAHKGRTGF